MLVVIYILLVGTDIRLKKYNFTTISALIVLIPVIICAFPYFSQKYIGEDIKDKNTISNRNALIICLIVMTIVISSSIYAGGILTTSKIIFDGNMNVKAHTALTKGESLST